MKVVVDTPIWSYALRSKKVAYNNHVSNLKNLISDGRVILIGPVRQEILSGYSDLKLFEKLKRKLSYFENTLITNDDFVEGAKLYNVCRKNGVQGSHTDFLICSVSIRLNAKIFTTDKDFSSYKKFIPIKLYDLISV